MMKVREKRYGQFFSGSKVADLLVSLLPDDITFQKVIDPMAGIGDMLYALAKKYPEIEKIAGIDIDRDVVETCKKRLTNAEIITGDAFVSNKINERGGWDLVITNPPYVRYQILKTNGEIGLPDGDKIRHNLLYHLSHSTLLDEWEKELFINLTKSYSGLSDMAVPSWILCASIVRKGGYLAMVVPETWLNRNYALPIHYLLLRCFDIIAVVKDAESVWFKNAQVRTCLIVAQRREEASIYTSHNMMLYLELGADVAGETSPIDNLLYCGDKSFDALKHLLESGQNISGKGFRARRMPAESLFTNLMNSLSVLQWVKPEDKIGRKEQDKIPEEIKFLIHSNREIFYDTLEDWGWHVGQGLRTGANDFFYAGIRSRYEDRAELLTRKWCGRSITVRNDLIKDLLQKRKEINGLCVNSEDLNQCVLYIQNQIRKEDFDRLSESYQNLYQNMDPELGQYITEAEAYLSPRNKKPFSELSAVKPNTKKNSEGYTRFWYMLPPLQDRHVPNLCIPRLCGDGVETLFVEQRNKNIVVDANFITLWNPDTALQMKTFALLNSTWFKCYMELIGTIMGAGALKIEASHVRQFFFPRISKEKEKELEEIGKDLYRNGKNDEKLQNKIDRVIASAYKEDNPEHMIYKLRDIFYRKIKERKH